MECKNNKWHLLMTSLIFYIIYIVWWGLGGRLCKPEATELHASGHEVYVACTIKREGGQRWLKVRDREIIHAESLRGHDQTCCILREFDLQHRLRLLLWGKNGLNAPECLSWWLMLPTELMWRQQRFRCRQRGCSLTWGQCLRHCILSLAHPPTAPPPFSSSNACLVLSFFCISSPD